MQHADGASASADAAGATTSRLSVLDRALYALFSRHAPRDVETEFHRIRQYVEYLAREASRRCSGSSQISPMTRP